MQYANIYLVGFMGVGKTTVGNILAKSLHKRLFDTDQWVIHKTGANIQEIFTTFGETYFRKQEQAALEALYPQSHTVAALGGGCYHRPEHQTSLQSWGTGIYLKASIPFLLHRLSQANRKNRPLLQASWSESYEENYTWIQNLLAIREKAYYQVKHIILIDTYSPSEIAEKIIGLLS